MRSFLLAALLLPAFGLAPVALAQKVEDKPDARSAASDDVAGTWTYTVVPPGADEERGTFTLVRNGAALTGTFTTDEPRKLDTAALDGSQLTLTFTQPEMGLITIRTVVTGDTMEGTAEVAGMDTGGTPIPFTAARAGAVEGDAPEGDASDGASE